MSVKSDVKIEINDSDDKNNLNEPSTSVSCEEVPKLEELPDSAVKVAKHDAASGDTASPQMISSQSMDFVKFLPEEVTDIVWSHLTPDDRFSCKCVSELWSRVIDDSIQRERMRLKTNWENGLFCSRYARAKFLELKDVTVIPSNVPHDYSIYLPLLWRREKKKLTFDFELLQITKSGLTVIVTIPFPRPEELLKVCVMKNSFVLITVFEIIFFDGHKLTPIRPFTVPDPPYEPPFLTMDTHYIVFLEKNSNLLLVWYKQPITVTFYRSAEPNICLNCSLFDGCFIISHNRNDPGKTSRIEVRNLRNAYNMLQLSFLVDGKVEYLDSNERFLFLDIKTYDYRCIQVRHKESYFITYCYKYSMSCCMTQVSNDIVIFREHNNPNQEFESKILSLSTGEWYKVPKIMFSKKLYTSFDNEFIVSWSRTKNTVVMFDWRNKELMHLQTTTPKSFNFIVLGVTDLMLVAINAHTGILVNFVFDKIDQKLGKFNFSSGEIQ